MLTAKACGLGDSTSPMAEGAVLVIRDRYGSPIVLAVELAPGLTQTFTLDNDRNFKAALKQYGIADHVEVRDVRV